MIFGKTTGREERLLETTASFSKKEVAVIRWYKNLYLGPNAAAHIEIIRKKAFANRRMAGVYYITLASTPGNLLDIFHNALLSEKLFASRQCQKIVGVAEGKQEALRLVSDMILEMYEKTGKFDVSSFFREEDFED